MTAPVAGRAVTVNMGELTVVSAHDRLFTILGSCIGLVLFDPHRQVAGLAHIMLPETDDPAPKMPGKYANHAVPELMARLAAAGAARPALQAKLAGGSAMFKLTNPNPGTLDIGARNAVAVRELLRAVRIPVLAEDVGGSRGRKLIFDPATAQMTIEIIGSASRVY